MFNKRVSLILSSSVPITLKFLSFLWVFAFLELDILFAIAWIVGFNGFFVDSFESLETSLEISRVFSFDCFDAVYSLSYDNEGSSFNLISLCLDFIFDL